MLAPRCPAPSPFVWSALAAAALLAAAGCHPTASSEPAGSPDAGSAAPAQPGSRSATGGAPATDTAALDASDPKQLLAEVDRRAAELKDSPKSFEVLAALGNLYYENSRYLDAVDSLRQALEKAAPLEAARDALAARGVQPAPAATLPLECRRSGPSYGLLQIGAAAKRLEASDPAKARLCLDSALSAVIDARARRADALFLIGNQDDALAEHRRVLERAPQYGESLFFVGAILLEKSQGEKAKLEEGKRYWRKLLEVAPDHPRAALVRESLPRADEIFARKAEQQQPVAGPVSPGAPLPAGHPPMNGGAPGSTAPLTGNTPGAPMAHTRAGPADTGPTPEMVQRVAESAGSTERTPELEKGLDALTAQAEAALDAGKYQEARDAIVRVMPMRPQDARTAADMGAAMRGLGRAEMAERVLQRAVELDARQPRALYEQGLLREAQGDKAGALQKLKAAQAADAGFAKAHHVAEEVAKLEKR